MKRESGFTLIELLVVVAIIGILAAMATAVLLRGRAAANEASAIGSVRTITSAQLVYAASCGRGFFAANLVTLGVPPPGTPAPFVSPDLSNAPVIQKSGYQIQIAPSATGQPGLTDCNGTATTSSFYASAEPLTFGVTGTRSFATTSVVNHTIWTLPSATAPAEPFSAPAAPLN